MADPSSYDVIIVGGGPGGSACARALTQAGLHVLVLERKRFPRVKLCAGWLSAPVWDVLELSPSEYPLGLWPWRRCHVEHAGRRHTLDASGHFIRRAEFDNFLLRRSGATPVEDHAVRKLERSDGHWLVDGVYRAPFLVGAGGANCPVAHQLFPKKRDTPVAVQERELEADATAIAGTRIGADGEPELLLHADLGGYSWNVPKGGWLNVGTGTSTPREVLDAWAAARAFFRDAGHLPPSVDRVLDHVEGYAYHLFEPAHLDACEHENAFLVGDALGLAHPLTAEGILPALLSGRLCGEAIAAGAPASYRARLAEHPVMRDYALARELLGVASALRAHRDILPHLRLPAAVRTGLVRASDAALVHGFAWMFSGRPIPYAAVLRGALRAFGANDR